MAKATTFNELRHEIQSRYDELSTRLQQVACYVLDNNSSVAFDTISVIAERAEVPPSTLIRFATAFGFNGFNEMKQLFRDNLLEETSSYTDRVSLFKAFEKGSALPERPIDILQAFSHANNHAMQQLALQTSPEKLEQALQLLVKANNIYVIGLGRSFSISSYLVYAFRHLSKRTFLVDGLGGMLKEQLSMVEADDVVIAISFSPYTKATIEISHSLMQAGIKQLTITDSQTSPLASSGDVCFVVKEAQVDAFRSQAASLCLAQTLVVSLALYERSGR